MVLTIIQIIKGVLGGVGDLGKELSYLLGPIANFLSHANEECKKNPGSWQCWLFQVATLILPIFGLIIAKWRRGKLTDAAETLSKLENKPSLDVTAELATVGREKGREVLDKLTPEQQSKSGVASYVLTLVVTKEEYDRISEVIKNSTDTDEEKQRQTQDARNRAQASRDEAAEHVDREAKDAADKQVPLDGH
ncbi:hypothetical protein EBT11_06900 [bacterium]|nr:hypothetical protein [bacterium]NBV97336.1 hypothetical protein [Verrucomicrobiota bacterium]